MNRFIIILILLLAISCSNNKDNNKTSINQYLNKFDDNLTNQFPKRLDFKNYDIITHESVRKNDIGIYLYLYNVEDNYIDSLLNLYNKNYLARYLNDTKCLLIVNRFETLDTYESTKKVIIDYDTRVGENKNCYNDKYPIPNFIDYRQLYKKNDTFLDENFITFVIHSSNSKSDKYDLIPNPQMPDKWANGYSKGVSINEIKKEVVFWSIMW